MQKLSPYIGLAKVKLCNTSMESGQSFLATFVGTLMIFFGVSTLSSPYALAQAGWLSLFGLVAVGFLYWSALILMIKCIDAFPNVDRYQQVALEAFGARGTVVTLILYIETAATLVGFLISFGDVITFLFPTSGHHLRVWTTVLLCIVLLPTIWTQSMKKITYLSYCCAASLVVIIVCVMIDAVLHGVNVNSVPMIAWSRVPRAIGIFSFGFGSAPVLPSIYTVMANRAQFTLISILSFVVFTFAFASFGAVAAMRFGESTQSIILLSMPRHAIISKVATWSAFVIPATKFTVLLCPIIADINQVCRTRFPNAGRLAAGMGSSLVVFSIMTVAILLPKFAGVIELVGACLDMALGVVLPPIFFLKLFYTQLNWKKKSQAFLLIVFGTAVAIPGTIASFHDLIK